MKVKERFTMKREYAAGIRNVITKVPEEEVKNDGLDPFPGKGGGD